MAVALVAAAASQNQAVTRFNNQVSTPDPRYHLVSDLGRDQPQSESHFHLKNKFLKISNSFINIWKPRTKFEASDKTAVSRNGLTITSHYQ